MTIVGILGLGGGNAATGIHRANRWRDGGLAARGARSTAGEAANNWIFWL
jgi:hypothetical protein